MDFSKDPAFRAAAAAAAAASGASISAAPTTKFNKDPAFRAAAAAAAGNSASPSPRTASPAQTASPAAQYAAQYEAPTAGPQMPQKRLRAAGGQVWQDATMELWDESDFRLFVGDLANDTTDDLLTKTFSRYPSFLRARVVRDKRTGKSRGYGFASFKTAEDFTRAFKDLNGKYIGHRPCKLRKSTWKDREMAEQDSDEVRELKRLRTIQAKGKLN